MILAQIPLSNITVIIQCLCGGEKKLKPLHAFPVAERDRENEKEQGGNQDDADINSCCATKRMRLTRRRKSVCPESVIRVKTSAHRQFYTHPWMHCLNSEA